MRPRLSADDEKDVFRALAHPVRRAMLLLLLDGEKPASALRVDGKMSAPSLSQHLRLLKRAGLVDDRRSGRYRIYRLEPNQLQPVRDYLAKFDR